MRLRIMTEQDVPGGVRLNTLSGWNQTAADWRRFLENSPRACFVMEHDGKVVELPAGDGQRLCGVLGQLSVVTARAQYVAAGRHIAD